jgi:hypothetical protein
LLSSNADVSSDEDEFHSTPSQAKVGKVVRRWTAEDELHVFQITSLDPKRPWEDVRAMFCDKQREPRTCKGLRVKYEHLCASGETVDSLQQRVAGAAQAADQDVVGSRWWTVEDKRWLLEVYDRLGAIWNDFYLHFNDGKRYHRSVRALKEKYWLLQGERSNAGESTGLGPPEPQEPAHVEDQQSSESTVE